MIRRPLFDIFGGTKALVLEVLLEIEAPLTGRAIARAAEVSPTTASIGLRELVAKRLVMASSSGSAVTYRINETHRLVPTLQRLMSSSRKAEEELVERVHRGLPGSPLGLYLFGSVARGDDDPQSDVDILVVAPDRSAADAWRSEAGSLGERLSVWLGRTVNLQISGSPTNADARRPFWRQVRRDGRRLSGLPLNDLIAS